MKQLRDNHFDLLIIGAGASGMAGAIAAKLCSSSLRVGVLEKNSSAGVKLRATGNGRCNIANANAPFYAEAEAFLADAGIIMRDNGKGWMYPYSESAEDAVLRLQGRLDELGVEAFFDCAANNVIKRQVEDNPAGRDLNISRGRSGRFLVETSLGEFTSDALIVASGGKAGPTFGTAGDGYKWARAMGHSVSRLAPVLTGIECPECAPLAGVRAKACVHVYKKGEQIFSERGEVQFTKEGLSGICVFNATTAMVFGEGEGIGDFELGIDFIPDEEIYNSLLNANACEGAAVNLCVQPNGGKPRDEADGNISNICELNAAELLLTVVKKKVIDFVLADTKEIVVSVSDMKFGKESNVSLNKAPDAASEAEPCIEGIKAAVDRFRDVRFKPSGIKGWRDAQCTAGGVPMSELDSATYESRLVPGLYFTGEMTEYYGPCGGYNLTHAWVSGARAGRAAAKLYGEREYGEPR